MKPGDMEGDVDLWREMEDRYGDYFEGCMGAEATQFSPRSCAGDEKRSAPVTRCITNPTGGISMSRLPGSRSAKFVPYLVPGLLGLLIIVVIPFAWNIYPLFVRNQINGREQ